uniref:uncharacterized protein n=1 Tax=Pristiophorus japonicus TaxID=55135 RepID=UPI00398EF3EF
MEGGGPARLCRDTGARTARQCRKKFIDLTRVVRAKLAHNRREQQRMRGGDPDLQDLTNVEERVTTLMCAPVGGQRVRAPLNSDDDEPDELQPARQLSSSHEGKDEEDLETSVAIERDPSSVSASGETSSVDESDGAAAGQQSVVANIAPDALRLPRRSGSGLLEMEGAVLPHDVNIPAPATASPPLHPPWPAPQPSHTAAIYPEAVL